MTETSSSCSTEHVAVTLWGGGSFKSWAVLRQWDAHPNTLPSISGFYCHGCMNRITERGCLSFLWHRALQRRGNKTPRMVCFNTTGWWFVSPPLVGGFNHFLSFSPRIPGEDEPILDKHIFQMGWWFNHQLDHGLVLVKRFCPRRTCIRQNAIGIMAWFPVASWIKWA